MSLDLLNSISIGNWKFALDLSFIFRNYLGIPKLKIPIAKIAANKIRSLFSNTSSFFFLILHWDIWFLLISYIVSNTYIAKIHIL